MVCNHHIFVPIHISGYLPIFWKNLFGFSPFIRRHLPSRRNEEAHGLTGKQHKDIPPFAFHCFKNGSVLRLDFILLFFLKLVILTHLLQHFDVGFLHLRRAVDDEEKQMKILKWLWFVRFLNDFSECKIWIYKGKYHEIRNIILGLYV